MLRGEAEAIEFTATFEIANKRCGFMTFSSLSRSFIAGISSSLKPHFRRIDITDYSFTLPVLIFKEGSITLIPVSALNENPLLGAFFLAAAQAIRFYVKEDGACEVNYGWAKENGDKCHFSIPLKSIAPSTVPYALPVGIMEGVLPEVYPAQDSEGVPIARTVSYGVPVIPYAHPVGILALPDMPSSTDPYGMPLALSIAIGIPVDIPARPREDSSATLDLRVTPIIDVADAQSVASVMSTSPIARPATATPFAAIDCTDASPGLSDDGQAKAVLGSLFEKL